MGTTADSPVPKTPRASKLCPGLRPARSVMGAIGTVKVGTQSRSEASSEAAVGRRTVTQIYIARALRDFGDGFVAVLLPVYLAAIGLGAFEIGVVATLALL